MKKICFVLLFVAASAFAQTFSVMTQLPTGAAPLPASQLAMAAANPGADVSRASVVFCDD